MRAVDVVERSKACDWTVNVHGMEVHASPPTEEDPVRVRSTHKHLRRRKYRNEYKVALSFPDLQHIHTNTQGE